MEELAELLRGDALGSERSEDSDFPPWWVECGRYGSEAAPVATASRLPAPGSRLPAPIQCVSSHRSSAVPPPACLPCRSLAYGGRRAWSGG